MTEAIPMILTRTGGIFFGVEKAQEQKFVDACSPATVQAHSSLTCSKYICGKSLRIQEADAAEAIHSCISS